MKEPRPFRPVAALLLVAVMTACRAAPQTAPVPDGPAAPSTPASMPDAEEREVRTSPAAIAEAREDSARIPYTAGDVRFMSDMIHHHAQAIMMSRMAPTHGASAQVQTLAARIINAQRDEIFIMQTWLADRQKPWPHVDAGGNVHAAAPAGGHAGHHGGQQMMAGMLTEAQVRQLDAAGGTEFDRLFLTFMIQHHQGAVAMVNELLSGGGAAHNDTVFRLAGDINVDQTTEIARMRKMLAELTPTQRTP